VRLLLSLKCVGMLIINDDARVECREAEAYMKQTYSQEILSDCDQSNVLLARIIFGILLKAFSFLSTCIRDPASN